MQKEKKWIFSPKRRASLKKAQRVHVELVRLGEKVRDKRS